MVRKMDEWHPKHRPITKIMLPDGVKGVPLPGRWDCGTISMKLNVIWGMSAKTGYEKLHRSAAFVSTFSVEVRIGC